MVGMLNTLSCDTYYLSNTDNYMQTDDQILPASDGQLPHVKQFHGLIHAFDYKGNAGIDCLCTCVFLDTCVVFMQY